jgi:superfamily II RNA helicase
MHHEWGNLNESAKLRQNILSVLDKIENVSCKSSKTKLTGFDASGRGIAGEINTNTLPQQIAELKSAVNAYVSGVTKYAQDISVSTKE